VGLYLGPVPEDIHAYSQAYRRDVERPWEVSSRSELLKAVEAAKVIFGGDFHSFPQAQRAHLRILRDLNPQLKVTLALEIFPHSDQGVVDQFMAGAFSEEEFLGRVHWDERWGFPWSFYRPLVDFAKKRGWKVEALNMLLSERSKETLHARDQFAAQKLKNLCQAPGVDLVYVVYGDLHIARQNLPAAFRQTYLAKKAPPSVTVYLNPEKAYFELAEQRVESQTEVISYSKSEFAVISSPPWVKWQNYLMFLEENHDFGFDEDEDEVDHTDHVLSLVRMISSALQIQVDENDIEVYGARDRVALERAQNLLGNTHSEYAKFLLRSDRSFYLPSEGFFYLSKPSVNHVATLAAQYIHAKLSGREKLLWDFPKRFVGLIWVESIAFLLSKFVNPKRKAQTMADLKKQLSVFHPKDEGREPLLLALDQKMSELLEVYKGESRGQNYRPRKKSSYLEAARFLGPILGERYFLLYESGRIGRDQVLELLSFDPSREDIAGFYYKQLAELDRLESEVRDESI